MKISNRASAPVWADLSATDVPAAKAFYEGLFGWSADEAPSEEAGGYGMFVLAGKQVGGFGPCMSPEAPTAWLVYFQVDDADAVATKVTQNGGTVVAAPMDVLDAGRMAVFTDPEGAVFGVWQPREHTGFGVIDEPGSVCWFELMARDSDKAKSFYAAVFGWEGQTNPAGPSEYTEWQLDGTSFSGMMRMNEDFPPELPAHWMVYVAVEDCDAAAARATELGGKVGVPPTDVPPGRFCIINDPQGGTISLIALSEGH
ncbi:VOC family protein [Streptomyces sp. NPDC048639]|uniref:VOC family protein n=1 Tax=Streptomyces sp. NPDC048639 TaxID=3365581 RepID=UPI00371E0D6A